MVRLALDAPVMPMGLCEDEQDMDQSFWLIQGPKGQGVFQSIKLLRLKIKTTRIKTAFPSFESPYKYDAQIERIITCDSATQAVLRLSLNKIRLFMHLIIYSVLITANMIKIKLIKFNLMLGHMN